MMPTILSPEHEAYRIAIENLAVGSDNSVFENSSPAHGAIVLANILRKSDKEVKVFTGTLDSSVCNYQYYLEALKYYLDRKKPLTIIFENDYDVNSLAFKMVKEYQKENDKIEVRKLINSTSVPHFTISDHKMLRVETSKTNFTAYCSFNSPSLVEPLENIYSTLVRDSVVAP